MNIQLITDDGADIPNSIKEELELKIVPLYVHFGEEQFQSGVSIDLPTFYTKLKTSSTFPQSSAPGPNEFYQAYKEIDKDKPILVISLSSGISSTYNHAVMGMNMLLEEEPQRQIQVIDSKTASCGILVLLQEANSKINEGYTFEQLVDHITTCTEKVTTLFVFKTVENLVRGGRLDKVKGALAKTLNIKLLMRASDEGKIEVAEKVRGDKKSIRRFVEQIGEYTTKTENTVIAMSHCNDADRASMIMEQIKQEYKFKETIIAEMGPVIATHAGQSGIVISFLKD